MKKLKSKIIGSYGISLVDDLYSSYKQYKMKGHIDEKLLLLCESIGSQLSFYWLPKEELSEILENEEGYERI